jgi:hypothetical protein
MPKKRTRKLIVTITTIAIDPEFQLLNILNGAVNTNQIEDFEIDFVPNE